MGILFCGGEIEDFSILGTVSATTTTSRFRSAYARIALEPAGGGLSTNNAKASFASSSQFWATFRLSTATSFTANSSFVVFSIGGAARLRLRLTSSSTGSTFFVDKYDGTTGTTLATSTGTLATSTLYRFDVAVSYGAAGRVRVWLDGTLALDTGTIDTTVSGATALDGVHFAAMSTTTSTTMFISEVIVADEDTRPLSLKTLAPNATGDSSQWTGAYTDVDETTASDTDVLSSATAGQVTNMECTGMPAGASGLAVRAVKVVASALRGTSGPQKLALGVKSGSTSGYSADLTLDTGYTTVSNTWTVNPATSAAFTGAEIDSLKLAVKSVA